MTSLSIEVSIHACESFQISRESNLYGPVFLNVSQEMAEKRDHAPHLFWPTERGTQLNLDIGDCSGPLVQFKSSLAHTSFLDVL